MARRVVASTEGNLPVEPEWRREVSDRLRSYRVRRHGGAAAALQSALPFEEESAVEDTLNLPDDAPPVPAERSTQRRRLHTERVEISIPRREIVYPAAEIHRRSAPQPGFGASPHSLFAIATLPLRRKAAILDITLLLFSYGGMLALFWALGGRIGFNKLDAVVTGATLALFYAQYFALFTIFGGCTPGMMLCRLRVMSFDGGVPTSRQMVWRSFGYVVSAGTCFLGFLWALWDEDQLCWQDRISRTYLTPIEELTRDAFPAIPARASGRTR
jgi:uncharacterized RDD family membrane protein YckC